MEAATADVMTRFGPYFVIAAGALLAVIGLYVLIRAHYGKNNIDLAYLLVDGALDPPRVTLAKATGFGAFLLSSWTLTYLTVAGKLDGTMFAAYLTVWGAVKVAGDITAQKGGGGP